MRTHPIDSLTPTDAPHLGVTNNVITSQVASGLIRGLFPFTTNAVALIQSSTFDSLEPTYSCPKASSLKADYTTGANGQAWQDHLELAKPVYAQLDRISGVELGDGAGWHVSFDQYVFSFPFSFYRMTLMRCVGTQLLRQYERQAVSWEVTPL